MAIYRPGPAWLALLFLLVFLLAPAASQEKKAETKAPDKKPATLRIKLRADARLEVEGRPVPGGGGERTVQTAPLAPGRRHSCTVKATWAPNGWTTVTRARKVDVKPGTMTEVDLRKADPRQPDTFFIRYVTTPAPVVEAMLKLARVGKGDVVYDLGCGDGRIVVAAVAKYGARRGVGVDIDPARVKDSKLTARKAGVADKVEFRQADVFKVKDLDKATVVCVYLGEELLAQLGPILRKALKPGARVVSHRFKMGDWRPDETRTVRVGATDRKIYLWTVKKKEE